MFQTLSNDIRPVMTSGSSPDDEPPHRHGDNGQGDGPGDGKGGDSEKERQNGLLLKTRPKTKKPSLYKVLILNDDYTRCRDSVSFHSDNRK